LPNYVVNLLKKIYNCVTLEILICGYWLLIWGYPTTTWYLKLENSSFFNYNFLENSIFGFEHLRMEYEKRIFIIPYLAVQMTCDLIHVSKHLVGC
jgi:hypothetical protein